MKYINLPQVRLKTAIVAIQLTLSEDIAFGTAISSSSKSSRFAKVSNSVDSSVPWALQYANEQKFRALTWSIYRSHGCFLWVSISWSSTGRATLRRGSSSSASFHTMSLLSLPCLIEESVDTTNSHGKAPHSRNKPISPGSRSQNRSFVRPPDCGCSFGGKAPNYNPAICIPGHEAAVGPDKDGRVDLSSMST